jgi:phage shock protein PspC (stress-responsive transcriptional regulator)
MTTNPPETPTPTGDSTDQGPRVTREEARDLGRLRRGVTDRHVAGVSGGLARHFDIDPIIIRVAFVVLGLMGPGIFLYIALWLLVPEEGKDKATIGTDEGLRTVLLVVVGVITLLGLIGNSWDPFWFPWQLIVVGVVAWWLLRRRDDQPAYDEVAYGQAGASPAPGWVGDTTTVPTGAQPSWVGVQAPPRGGAPRDPRKRGPRLFGFTLALVAVALGALGMADLAGADVADSAYPALALGLIALMLLIGAFWGRAGGLIFLGIVAALVTAGSTATENWDGGQETNRPLAAAQVDDEYWLDTGELIIDLTDVEDLEALDGREIEVGVGMGQVRVFVPSGLDVTVDAEVGGPGNVQLFDDNRGGIHVEDDAHHDGGPDAPALTIDAHVGIGEIVVKTR